MRTLPAWNACVQMLVYEASVTTPVENAMVLPLPVSPQAGANGIRLLDLSGTPEFFKTLFDMFPAPAHPGQLLGFGAPPPAAPPLAVHRVGSYDVSIVPTIHDFSRLSSIFRLDVSAPVAPLGAPPFGPRGLLAIFWQKYADCSFIVCQFAPGQRDLHPFGVTFVTRYPDHLFFPTLHIHDGALHEQAYFEHKLYAQRARLATAGPRLCDTIDGARLAQKVSFLYPLQTVERTSLFGMYSNADVYFPIADPLAPLE